jgi:hypothetical protein
MVWRLEGVEGTHRIGRDLAHVAKGDVLPAVISVTIGPKVVRGDEDGLGDRRLVFRVRPTWRGGSTQWEIQGQKLDAISSLHRTKPKSR